jgi:anti-sigma factor RsiW
MDRHDVTDTDLQAYIDGQLDPARRVEVETYLGAHPVAAAEVMEGLRLRDELRLFLAEEAWPPAPKTVAMGHYLAWTLGRRTPMRVLHGIMLGLRGVVPRLRVGLVAACLIGLGWVGHAGLGGLAAGDQEVATDPAEALADDAAQAWHVVQLGLEAPRPSEVDLPQTPTPDKATPAPAPLPGGLQRVGADVMRWDGGTAAVELLVTRKGDELVLLTAETSIPGLEAPEVERAAGVTTVSWRLGRYAYALSGDVPAADLLRLAHTIAPGG